MDTPSRASLFLPPTMSYLLFSDYICLHLGEKKKKHKHLKPFVVTKMTFDLWQKKQAAKMTELWQICLGCFLKCHSFSLTVAGQ